MAEHEGKSRWEARLAGLEAEVERAIAYVNEEVVPEIRKEGFRALHAAAEELRRLANRMDGSRPDRPR